MAETFTGFIEGFGPGTRGNECLVCMEHLGAAKPTVTHSVCGNTFCRQCFMSDVIHSFAARPLQATTCPACRGPIVIKDSPTSVIERIGTDGLHNESFWPRVGNFVIPLSEISPDYLTRVQSLIAANVLASDYNLSPHIERAIICPSVSAFLEHVALRGTFLAGQPRRPPGYLPRYIRYADIVPTNLVRWLHTTRSLLPSPFVRWLIRDSTTTRLDTDDPGLHSLVWRGVIPEGLEDMTFPAAARRFIPFRFDSSWYLVPEFPKDQLSLLDAEFWTLGDAAWAAGWRQQGEELDRFFRAVPDGMTPYYAVRLGAVGPLRAGADTTYILRTDSLGNSLARWPGAAWERTVVFGSLVAYGTFARDLGQATGGMPRVNAGGWQAGQDFMLERAVRGGKVVNGWGATPEDDIIPPPVPGSMRMIVGSVY
jgi:hypothetical protein